jgi:hypothetical protein
MGRVALAAMAERNAKLVRLLPQRTFRPLQSDLNQKGSSPLERTA